jgi:enterochelin esterase-like enzyme
MRILSRKRPNRRQAIGVFSAMAAVTAAILIAAIVGPQSAGHAAAAVTHEAGTSQSLGPQITRTNRGPTGYEVTFRYDNPTATSVLIEGDWSFASEASEANDENNVPASSTGTSTVSPVTPPGGPILPAQWKPGDFQLQSLDMPGEEWPVASMTKNSSGVWTYTVPLPNGWYDYEFYPNCTSASASKCTGITDPANPPELTACATCNQSSTEPFSEVYVPDDRRYDPVDLSWQSNDLPASQTGKIVDVPIPDTQSSTGTTNLAVYTPPGYNPKRSTAYPLFVLSHGGGENELAWADRGMVVQIVDNAIAAHEIQPMVIVMPNGVGNYTTDVTTQIIPWVEANYDVSTSSSDRAFAGTSAYGTQANDFLFDDTTEFGYVGAWSPAGGAPTITFTGGGATPATPAYEAPALKQVLGIDVAIGRYDVGGNLPQLTASTEREGFIENGVNFRWFTADGGHTWVFWRLALQDFLLHSVFRTTTTAATVTSTSAGDTVAVSVTADSAEPAAPTGTAQVYVTSKAAGDCTTGGYCYPVAVGHPVTLRGGTATITVPASEIPAGSTVTAQYSGDNYYNASTS